MKQRERMPSLLYAINSSELQREITGPGVRSQQVCPRNKNSTVNPREKPFPMSGPRISLSPSVLGDEKNHVSTNRRYRLAHDAG
jgi:hypothetical protein